MKQVIQQSKKLLVAFVLMLSCTIFCSVFALAASDSTINPVSSVQVIQNTQMQGYKSTSDKKKLATPSLVSVKTTTKGLEFSWKKVSGASKYCVLRKTNNGSWKKVKNTASTKFTDTTVKSGNKYTYTVRCINAAGTVYESAYNKAGKSRYYLSTPTMQAKKSGKNVIATWKAVAGATNYQVYRKTSSSSWKKIATVKTLKYIDKTVKSGVKYYYSVRAVRGSSKSAYKKSNGVYIEDAIPAGYIEVRGKIRYFNYYEILKWQGCSDPNPGSTDRSHKYCMLILDTPGNLRLNSCDGMTTRYVKGICLDDCKAVSSFSSYAGVSHVFRINAKTTYFPSDTSLPLGVPRAEDVIFVR